MPYTLPLNAQAPPFSLPATDGKSYTLESFRSSPFLVLFFTCNHCPYVIGSNELTRKAASRFATQGVRFVAINSNSSELYPTDSFEGMVEEMERHHFPWVYLHDRSQEVARAYGALRTPHFYLFNQERKLVYCGRGCDSPRDVSKMKINDLENALEDLVAGVPIRTPLTNPIGCTLKWLGKDSHWMPPEACDLVH